MPEIMAHNLRQATMQGEPAARLGTSWTAGPGHKRPFDDAHPVNSYDAENHGWWPN